MNRNNSISITESGMIFGAYSPDDAFELEKAVYE